MILSLSYHAPIAAHTYITESVYSDLFVFMLFAEYEHKSAFCQERKKTCESEKEKWRVGSKEIIGCSDNKKNAVSSIHKPTDL